MEVSKQVENINSQAINTTDDKMNTVYMKQKQAMQEIMSFIALLYFHYEVNGSIKLNKTQKAIVFKELNSKLIRIYNELTSTEKETLTNVLSENYKFLYNELFNIYNINGIQKPLITEQEIMTAVLMPIAGKIFTDRIVVDKTKTIGLLKKSFKNIVNGNVDSETAKKQIENVFAITAYDTQRLANSENTRVSAQASNDVCTTLGIKKHIWRATFENTCAKCRKLDGKPFNIDDKEAPTQPLHANCRCYFEPII